MLLSPCLRHRQRRHSHLCHCQHQRRPSQSRYKILSNISCDIIVIHAWDYTLVLDVKRLRLKNFLREDCFVVVRLFFGLAFLFQGAVQEKLLRTWNMYMFFFYKKKGKKINTLISFQFIN